MLPSIFPQAQMIIICE